MTTEQFQVLIGIAKDIAQVVALLGVGLWTLFIYFRSETPSAAGQISATSSLIRNDRNGTTEVGMRVAVNNNGKTFFQVNAVSVRVWTVAFTPNQSVVSVESVHQVPPLIERSFTTGSLVGRHGPGEAATDWFFVAVPSTMGDRLWIEARMIGSVPTFWGRPRYRETHAYGWMNLAQPVGTTSERIPIDVVITSVAQSASQPPTPASVQQ